MSQLKLPELGEGVDVVDVSAVLVGVGDFVKRDQPVIEVETEKASLEVPSTADGKVAEVLVKAGEQIKVGQTILRIDAQASAGAPQEQKSAEAASATSAPAAAEAGAPAGAAPPSSDAPAADSSDPSRPELELIRFPGAADREARPPRPEPGSTVPASPGRT